MDNSASETALTLSQVNELCLSVLDRQGVSPEQAGAIARNITAAERDVCRSHGLFRLLGYVRATVSGMANAAAVPQLLEQVGAIVRVDAGRGFAPLANEVGRPALIAAAQKHGLAALAINHCIHNSALWADLEPLADAGLVSIGLTAGQCSVAPHGGSKPIFGTNPFAFGWPRPNKPAFVFDFATSAIARGEIELHGRAGKALQEGWAVNKDGQPTTDPASALAGAMLPFGGHKGTALALMVELLAGPLIGDLTSAEAVVEDGGTKSPPMGGELIIAFDPKRFLGDEMDTHFQRAEVLFESMTAQDGVRLPGDRRLAARLKSDFDGITVPDALLAELRALEK